MDRPALAIFIHEIRNQCLYTEAAFSIFNQSLEQKAINGTFLAAHSVLMNAGQIASILWPTRARSKKRGETLREVLNLPEKHPLNDRRIIENWEKGDEKLEEWIATTKNNSVVFDHIGPMDEFTDITIEQQHIYRMFDTKTLIFYYRGDGFKLKVIADSISDIFSKANAAHRQLLPEHHAELQQAPAPAATPASPNNDNEAGAETSDTGNGKSKPKSGKAKKEK